MRICIMVRIRQDPPHTRMWRDDLKITANRSGLHLVSYTEASHRTGRRLALARSIGVGRSDGLPPPRYERIEKRFRSDCLSPNNSAAARCILGMAHYRLARAFAVNPARLTARPCGLRGLTANRGPSKKESPCQNARERPPFSGARSPPQPNRWTEQADRRACGNFPRLTERAPYKGLWTLGGLLGLSRRPA